MADYTREYIASFPRISIVLALMSMTAAYLQRSEYSWWLAAGGGAVFLWLAMKVIVVPMLHSRLISVPRRPWLTMGLIVGSLWAA